MLTQRQPHTSAPRRCIQAISLSRSGELAPSLPAPFATTEECIAPLSFDRAIADIRLLVEKYPDGLEGYEGERPNGV